MRKLILGAVFAAAATALACGSGGTTDNAPASGGNGSGESQGNRKQTSIHFTKNYNKGTGSDQYNTDCIGIISTETIGAVKGTNIMWHVKKKNGHNDDDQCTTLEVSTVKLVFDTNVMGVAELTANGGGVIMGDVSMDAAGGVSHKYQVYVGTEKAGPDPVIIVDCSDCGPGPSGPGE